MPATIEARSSATTLLLNRTLDTFFFAIRSASPSAIADFPTPGSPIRTGLFFFLLERICASLSISLSRPTTGSSLPSSAAFVRSMPKLSRTGVSEDVFEADEDPDWPLPWPPNACPSSSSSLGKSAFAEGYPDSTARRTV